MPYPDLGTSYQFLSSHNHCDVTTAVLQYIHSFIVISIDQTCIIYLKKRIYIISFSFVCCLEWLHHSQGIPVSVRLPCSIYHLTTGTIGSKQHSKYQQHFHGRFFP